jgi:hypothetical protein
MLSVAQVTYSLLIELRNIKQSVRSDCSLIWGTVPVFCLEETEETHEEPEVRTVDFRADIWTWGLQNTNQEWQSLDGDVRMQKQTHIVIISPFRVHFTYQVQKKHINKNNVL